MTVWVKECGTNFTKGTIELWLKDGVDVKIYESIHSVDISDIVVISENDSDIEGIDAELYTVLVYEEYFQKITQNVIREYNYNYDFYHLRHALERACKPEVNTIITGSSYGLFGIDEAMLTNEVNLCLASQDIYYSAQGIYKVCRENKNIKNVVMCLAYYVFCTDLSKTQNMAEISRISKVYEPLFGDLHNCKLLPPKQEILYHSEVFDMEKVLDIYARGECEKTYFHSSHNRNSLATRMWDDVGKDWKDLSCEEKCVAARRRAAMHNKSKNRFNTLEENAKVFNELSNFCADNNINLIVVVTPVSKYYLKELYPGYKDIFYEVLSETDGVIHLLDLVADEAYADEDFNDMDHLGDSGAKKLTQGILELMNEL